MPRARADSSARTFTNGKRHVRTDTARNSSQRIDGKPDPYVVRRFPSPISPLIQVMLVSIVSHIAQVGSRVTTSLYALSLHASEFTVGLLVALFSLLPMIFAVAIGRLIGRIGIARPMMTGCLIISAGCGLPSIISGLPVLYIASVMIGTGFMVIQVASQHAGGVMSVPANRTQYFSWIALSYSISGFLGPVIAGFLIDHAQFSITYGVFAIFGLLGMLLVLFSDLGQVRGAPHSRDGRAKSRGALDLLQDREMRQICTVAFLLAASWDLFTFVVPIQGSRQGFSASTIGVILGCFALATFAVRLASPWISRHYTEWKVLAASLILALICYGLFPFLHTPVAMMTVAATLGLALGATQPNLMSLLYTAAPAGRAAEAVAIRVAIVSGCQVMLPLTFGAVGAALGLFPVFWGMSAMIGAGVPIAWRKAYPRNVFNTNRNDKDSP